MEAYQRRNKQIKEAIFDHFVNQHILIENVDSISEDGIIDKRFLNGLAKELDCKPPALHAAITTSCARMLGDKAAQKCPTDEEEAVMLAVIKRRIKFNREPLVNNRRIYGNLAAQLNKMRPNLRMSLEELLQFANPIYHETVDEVFPNKTVPLCQGETA